MENKKKVIVGFDIGISSVGWCITMLDDLKIVKHGVRTFSTVDDPKDSKLLNEERRVARSHRRQVNRKKTLKRDFIKYLIESKFIDDLQFDREGKFVNQFREKYINNPQWRKQLDKDSEFKTMGGIFDLRLKGLTEELTKKELISVLYWYINHRGFKYTVVDEKPKKAKGSKNTEQPKYNKDLLPIEQQIAQFESNGFLNGNFNQKFHQKYYIEEIEQIFQNIKNIKNITKDFKEKFFEFFKRQRSFEQGPGNKQTFSMYGIRDYDQNGKLIKKYKTIWEKTVGKCSIYLEEDRAPKFSFSAELFNLLNDLNNISIDQNSCQKRLTFQQKIAIIKISLKTNANLKSVIKYIKKEFDLENESFINGLRSKKTSKNKTIELNLEITPLKTWHFFKKIFEKINYQYQFENLFNDKNEYNKQNLINKLSEIFSKSTLEELRSKEIKKLKEFNKDQLKQIAGTPGFKAGTHAFSLKALNELIAIMLVEEKNSQQIIYQKQKNSNFQKYKIKPSSKLTNQWVEDLITTPTVKRSLNQTIKIFNAIKEYLKRNNLQISDIIIEMAREKNNKEKRENETNYQKMLELENERINQYLDHYPNVKKTNALRRKIWLWMQQNGKDAYNGEEIAIDYLINNIQNFEEDHIIPYSCCFDNSRNNRVLTSKENNQKKGKRTPFQYMNSKEFEKMKQNWNNWYLDKYSDERKMFFCKKKYDFLISEKDFSDPKHQLEYGFIGRNLVDTRYTTKEFLNVLNQFKEINDLQFKVKVVNGKMTSFVRSQLIKNKLFLENPCFTEEEIRKMKKKDRIWHGHHAQDAYICTFLCKWYKDQKRIEKFIDVDLLNKTDSVNWKEKREVESEKKFYQQKFQEFKKAIPNIYDQLDQNVSEMLFSRRIEKKSNTKLFNETLYRGIKKDDQIQKFVYKNLLKMNKKDCQNYFDINSKDCEKVVMKKWNKKMYAQLCEIYQSYKDQSFPFKKAAEDNKENFIVCLIKNKKVTIKKIQIFQEFKNKDVVISIKKDLKIKENKNPFYDSLKPIMVHLYMTRKKRKQLISINALNCNFFVKPIKKDEKWINKNTFKIDQDKLNYQKEKLDIPSENEPIDVFYRGEILESQQKLFYVIGAKNNNVIEIKPINYNYYLLNSYYHEKKDPREKPSRLNKSINTFEYKKIKLNCLGFKI